MKARLRAWVSLALACSLSLSAFSVPAAEAAPTQQQLDQARERFQRGVDLYKEGNFDAALAEFTRAYELAPNYRILFNLAQTQLERHDSVAAWRLLYQYLEQGKDEISPERRAQVERDMEALQKRVAELRLQIDVAGAELMVDGVVVGVTPLKQPVWVNSGLRQVTVRKQGYRASTRSVSVPGGEPISVAIHLESDPSAAPVTTVVAPAPRPPEKGPNTALWLTGAISVVFTGTAVTFGLLTLRANDRLDRELEHFPGDAKRLDERRDQLRTLALLTDGFAGAAVIAAGATIYLGLSARSQPSNTATVSNLRAGVRGSSLVIQGAF